MDMEEAQAFYADPANQVPAGPPVRRVRPRRRLLHVHRDLDYQLRGVHYYYQCKCGARRVRLAYTRMCGPVDPGWPQLTDRHGNPVRDSGWHGGPNRG